MTEQSIVIKDRKSIVVTGISSVDSFNETTIVATSLSEDTVVVEGNGLKLCDVNLDNFLFEAEGNITAVFYDEKISVKKSFFGFGKK